MTVRRGCVLETESTADTQVLSEAGALAQCRGRGGGAACGAGANPREQRLRNPGSMFKTQEAADCEKRHKNKTRTKNLFPGFHSNKRKADFGEDSHYLSATTVGPLLPGTGGRKWME